METGGSRASLIIDGRSVDCTITYRSSVDLLPKPISFYAPKEEWLYKQYMTGLREETAEVWCDAPIEILDVTLKHALEAMLPDYIWTSSIRQGQRYHATFIKSSAR